MQSAAFTDGHVVLDGAVHWPDGARLVVTLVESAPVGAWSDGEVIIAGFGLAGRGIADLLANVKIPYTIIEQNPVTVETQRALGRHVVQGSATDASTLAEAGFYTASILALTMPDEDGVLRAVALARRLRPDIYIIARTNYSSQGMKAAQLGANDVIKAEQAVALQFYERLSKRLNRPAETPAV